MKQLDIHCFQFLKSSDELLKMLRSCVKHLVRVQLTAIQHSHITILDIQILLVTCEKLELLNIEIVDTSKTFRHTVRGLIRHCWYSRINNNKDLIVNVRSIDLILLADFFQCVNDFTSISIEGKGIRSDALFDVITLRNHRLIKFSLFDGDQSYNSNFMKLLMCECELLEDIHLWSGDLMNNCALKLDLLLSLYVYNRDKFSKNKSVPSVIKISRSFVKVTFHNLPVRFNRLPVFRFVIFRESCNKITK